MPEPIDYAERRKKIGDHGSWLAVMCAFCNNWEVGLVLDLRPNHNVTITEALYGVLNEALGEHYVETRCRPDLTSATDVARWLAS